MSNLFYDGNGIGSLNGTLTKINQFLKKLVHIGQVKISGQDQVFCLPIVIPDEWMQAFDCICTKCSIPQMAQVEFAVHLQVLFKPIRIQ